MLAVPISVKFGEKERDINNCRPIYYMAAQTIRLVSLVVKIKEP